jgi:hypothetical protein
MKKPEIEIPAHMKNLEVTDKGYLKPWFVKADDFRIVDGVKAGLAVTKKRCWICGEAFDGSEYALVGDPQSAMIRLCKEPPCHRDCAEYAVQVCPFILYPNAKRRVAGLEPEQTLDHTNKTRKIKIGKDNPGKYYIIVVRDFEYQHSGQIIRFKEEDVIERQYWIGGTRQESHPDPIIPLDELPQNLRHLI